MTNISNSFLDILSPKERMFYSQYRLDTSDSLTQEHKKIMRNIINKRIIWCRERKIIKNIAFNVAKSADVRKRSDCARIEQVIYEAWAWAQTH